MAQAQAQPQPNYQRLTDAFTAAAEECSRLPNIPAIRDSQALVEAISQLRDEVRDLATKTTERFDTVQATLTTVQADITTVRGDITTVRGGITTLGADVTSHHTNLTARLNASETNVTARVYNSTINNAHTLFQPLRDRHDMPVPNFPDHGEALSNLSRNELLTILRAFNLSTDGDVDDKRKRLAHYIGIVVQVFRGKREVTGAGDSGLSS